MSVEHVSSLEAFTQILNTTTHKLVVVDFHATWCGPCHAIAPLYEKLAGRYAGRARFLKVDVDEAQQISRKCSVSAMPTFHMYLRGRRVVEFSGANPARLQSELERHAPSSADVSFASQGQVLGSNGVSKPDEENGSASKNAPPTKSMAETAAAAAEKRSSSAGSSTEKPAEVSSATDSRLKVNPVFLKTLVSELGFPPVRAEKSLILTGNKSVEHAVTWCFEHADDVDIDEPLQVVTEDGAPSKKLTNEEAKAKADELYTRARAKRSADDKAAAIQSEKDRVRSGKQITAAKQQHEDEARKRAVEEKKREKKEALAERQRVREMLEADRQRRRERFNMSGGSTPAAQPTETTSRSKQRSRRADPEVSSGKIQFRLPDGTRVEGDFKPEQTMDDLVLFLQVTRPDLAGGNMSFSQQYPRRQFSRSEHSLTLGELLLLPRGALTVSIAQ